MDVARGSLVIPASLLRLSLPLCFFVNLPFSWVPIVKSFLSGDCSVVTRPRDDSCTESVPSCFFPSRREAPDTSTFSFFFITPALLSSSSLESFVALLSPFLARFFPFCKTHGASSFDFFLMAPALLSSSSLDL